MSKLTIKELAEMAGVSPTAVSFVLNGRPGVSEKTRTRVLEIIDKVGYTANFSSRCLAFQKSFNIALLYSESSSPFDDLFYFDVARGALERCNEKGYNLVLNKIQYCKNQLSLPNIITCHNADGALVFQDTDPEVIREIESNGIPVIVVDSYVSEDSYASIGINADTVTECALKYLIQNGHRDIGLIAIGYLPDFRDQVYATFQRVLQENGLIFHPEWAVDQAIDEESALVCTQQIMEQAQKPSAIFCTSDVYAIGALRYLKENGFSVPHDVSVIGADNIMAGRYISPSLTTVDYNKVQLGKDSFDMLLKRIEGDTVASIRMGIQGIQERESVRNLLASSPES